MSLESQLKKVEALKAKIKETQSKIESKLGKAIIKALDLDYKELSNKEDMEKIINTIIEHYPKTENVDNESNNETLNTDIIENE
ncbi:hypothetical protein [Streptococcus sp. HMSC10E12]|uniref:hypothetical protein n=1 Tax=Streptococcus sp. HMSC10E12 TaxID=1581080 RepID=UPI0008A2D944|nr:hypothetical protein [Streptococcus sp. HMSC10E12]OFU82381.1 hypothetical protein HMPREF3112_09790 [Streptococcus sp. HMSC10E12]